MKRILCLLLVMLVLAGCSPLPEAVEVVATPTPVPTPEPTPEPEGLLKEFGSEEVTALLYAQNKAADTWILEQAKTELEEMGITAEIHYDMVDVSEYDLAVICEDSEEMTEKCVQAGIATTVISPGASSFSEVNTISYAEGQDYIMLMDAILDYEHHTTPVRMAGVFSARDSEAAVTFESYKALGKVLDKQQTILSEFEIETEEEEPQDSTDDEQDEETPDNDATDETSNGENEDGTENDDSADDTTDDDTENEPTDDEIKTQDMFLPEHYDMLKEQIALLLESHYEGMLDAILVEDEAMTFAVGAVFEEMGRSDIEVCTVGNSPQLTYKMSQIPDLYAISVGSEVSNIGVNAARLSLTTLRDGGTQNVQLPRAVYYASDSSEVEPLQEYNQAWMDELRAWNQG